MSVLGPPGREIFRPSAVERFVRGTAATEPAPTPPPRVAALYGLTALLALAGLLLVRLIVSAPPAGPVEPAAPAAAAANVEARR